MKIRAEQLLSERSKKRRTMKIRVGVMAILMVWGSSAFGILERYRAPLDFIRKGYTHFQLDPVESRWWYDAMKCDRECENYYWETWTGGFGRYADKVFLDCKECDDNTNILDCSSNTTNTVPLATLLFGKEAFRYEESLVNGFVNTTDATMTSGTGGTVGLDNLDALVNTSPFLAFAQMSPKFDYNEYGAYWGARMECTFGCDNEWRVGARVSVPFKVVEIEHDTDCKVEETMSDVISAVQVAGVGDTPGTPPLITTDITARMDFLSTLLVRNFSDPPTSVDKRAFVSYDDPSGNGTRIYDEVAAAGASQTAVNSLFVRNSDGDITALEYPYRKIVLSANANFPAVTASALAADGSGGSDGSVLFLESGVDYRDGLGQNRQAQRELFWVIPVGVIPSTAGFADRFRAGAPGQAQQIHDQIALTIANYSTREGVIDYLKKRGLDLCSRERVLGLGDLDAEIYVGYCDRTDYYLDFLLGVRLPTGTKRKDEDALNVLRTETGNNRHWEIKLGLEGGYKACDWFALKMDFSYSHVFKRTEKMPAAFKGATVKNLGPAVDADLSWNYFMFHTDFNFFHWCNPDLGATIGYELFAKLKDRIEFCQTTATDLLGRPDQELDSSVLEANTKSMLHKIRGEVFHRWNFFEIYLGGSHAIGGRQAMKETEGHVGFTVYF